MQFLLTSQTRFFLSCLEEKNIDKITVFIELKSCLLTVYYKNNTKFSGYLENRRNEKPNINLANLTNRFM